MKKNKSKKLFSIHVIMLCIAISVITGFIFGFYVGKEYIIKLARDSILNLCKLLV